MSFAEDHHRWNWQDRIWRRAITGSTDRCGRRQARTCSARHRRHRSAGYARMGRLVFTHYDGRRWGPVAGSLVLARCDDRCLGKLRCGLCTGEEASSPGPHGFDGRCRGNSNPVLAAGLTWEWESFPDFMDALEHRERAIDIAAQAAHLPMRVYVMGHRAIRREPATADDIVEMRRLTIEALRAGAFGFTT